MVRDVNAILLKAWGDAYRRRYGKEYASGSGDSKALVILTRQAERRGWNLHNAIRFFDTALDLLEEDPHWKDRIGLLGVASRIDGVYALAKERAQEDKAVVVPDEKPSLPPGESVAELEMAKIRGILGRRGGAE